MSSDSVAARCPVFSQRKERLLQRLCVVSAVKSSSDAATLANRLLQQTSRRHSITYVCLMDLFNLAGIIGAAAMEANGEMCA